MQFDDGTKVWLSDDGETVHFEFRGAGSLRIQVAPNEPRPETPPVLAAAVSAFPTPRGSQALVMA
jgi:hypothetical protein